MIAIAAISEKLATIAARLTIACPGAPRSWASARVNGMFLPVSVFSNTNPETQGIRKIPPNSRQAMESVAGDRNAVHGPWQAGKPMPRQMHSNPGQSFTARANIACSSPALSACAGAVRAASSAGSSAPAIATAMPAST